MAVDRDFERHVEENSGEAQRLSDERRAQLAFARADAWARSKPGTRYEDVQPEQLKES